MKRLTIAVAALLLLAALILPFEGIWVPGQIVSAAVDGQTVPRERMAELYWDLQRSRMGGAPSKCLGWVDLELANGVHKRARLSQAIALHHWTADCP
ncbi:MAG: hypothetical protein ACM3XM_15715 [Mycobacterium leprae]